MPQTNFQISIIIPALNEERNVERAVHDVLSALEELRIFGEIILIDDGSTDETSRIIDALSKESPSIQVIHHPENKGIGYSFWEGAQIARGDAVVMMPGDGENSPKEILRYLPLMSEVDIVIPFVFNTGNRKFSRQLISKVYKAIINLTFGLLLNYMNGTVMYRRSTLLSLSLTSSGFFYQTELLIKAIRHGYLYAEVPCAIRVRHEGRSKAISFLSLFKLSKDYLKILFSVYFEWITKEKIFPADSATLKRKLER